MRFIADKYHYCEYVNLFIDNIIPGKRIGPNFSGDEPTNLFNRIGPRFSAGEPSMLFNRIGPSFSVGKPTILFCLGTHPSIGSRTEMLENMIMRIIMLDFVVLGQILV